MSTQRWLALQTTEDHRRFTLPLDARVLTHAGALHGGAGLAAAVDAAERATGRPLVWATAQYLRHAGPSGVADVDVVVELDGHHTSQARATMRVDGIDVLSAFTAHGQRDFARVRGVGHATRRPTAGAVRGMADAVGGRIAARLLRRTAGVGADGRRR